MYRDNSILTIDSMVYRKGKLSKKAGQKKKQALFHILPPPTLKAKK